MSKLVYLLALLLVGVAISFRTSAKRSRDAVPMPVRDASAPVSLRPVHWTIVGGSSARTLTPGRAIPITLAAEIANGWHIYSMTQKSGGPIPLTIRVLDASDASIRGVVKAPDPERHFDKNFGIETELYSGNPRFTVQVALPGRTTPGKHSIQLGARYQVCSETLCLPPRTDTLSATLRVATRT